MPQKSLSIEFQEYALPADTGGLEVDEIKLIKSAWEAREKAHALYSHFKVGAAILTLDGQIIKGSNQETANYKGSCAEKVALDSLGATGLRQRIYKIAIVGGPEGLNLVEQPLEPEDPITPCGQCRQDINECECVAGREIIIIMASRNMMRRMVGVKNLLPFAFGPGNL